MSPEEQDLWFAYNQQNITEMTGYTCYIYNIHSAAHFSSMVVLIKNESKNIKWSEWEKKWN